jgi:hypothetical protein
MKQILKMEIEGCLVKKADMNSDEVLGSHEETLEDPG